MTEKITTLQATSSTGLETDTQNKPKPTPPTTTEEGLVAVRFLPADQKVELGPGIPFEEGLILKSREGTFVLSFPFDRAEQLGKGKEALEHLKRQAAAHWRGTVKGQAPCHLRLAIACPEHGIQGAWEVDLGNAHKPAS